MPFGRLTILTRKFLPLWEADENNSYDERGKITIMSLLPDEMASFVLLPDEKCATATAGFGVCTSSTLPKKVNHQKTSTKGRKVRRKTI